MGLCGASLVAQLVKNLPTMQETWVRSLAREDPLEEGMATHSSILSWKIPWTEEPGRLQSIGSQKVMHDWASMQGSKKLGPRGKLWPLPVLVKFYWNTTLLISLYIVYGYFCRTMTEMTSCQRELMTNKAWNTLWSLTEKICWPMG